MKLGVTPLRMVLHSLKYVWDLTVNLFFIGVVTTCYINVQLFVNKLM